jgi:hypothetical protein
MDVPYLDGSPRMTREGKQLCAKKVRTNVEGEATLAWGIKVLQWNSPHSTTGSGHRPHPPLADFSTQLKRVRIPALRDIASF